MILRIVDIGFLKYLLNVKSMSQCILKCINNSHPPIPLPHDTDVFIGRSYVTKIKNQSCSRKQIRLKADHNEKIVEIEQVGVNPSGLNGFAMDKTASYKVGHGAKLEILFNNYEHVIEFDVSSNESKSSKRKLEEPCVDEKRKKHLKLETEPTAEANWDDIDKGELYVYTAKGVKASSKVASFDMDFTLIKTKSGKVFPTDINDWQLMFSSIPSKLKEYNEHKVVIFSNQAPLGNGKVKIEDFKIKIEKIIEKLQVPVQVFLATGKGIYRKPLLGMWNVLEKSKNGGILIDKENSFYCGDAAGRVANWAPGKKKDHSMGDKLFAENLGLKFYTPEQFFLGHSISNVKMNKPEFNPKDVKSDTFNQKLINNEKEILVLVGFPGSGKSFISKQIEEKSSHKYSTVCRDVLGSWQKCASEAVKLLQQGKSVIVDSTNPDIESRARWISLAKEQKVKCRCAKMEATLAHARHNNRFRELMKTNHVAVNDIVFHTYKNKFVEPKTSEGFEEIIQVKFNPKFKNEKEESTYRMHLLEK